MNKTRNNQRSPKKRGRVYISADIEADGPIPGPYSMSSAGLCIASHFEDGRFVPHDPEAQTFYTELKPISEDFIPEAAAVSGIPRETLLCDGEEPQRAMIRMNTWVREVSGDRSPILVAWPLSFDWMWLYWYFMRFNDGKSPFGFSGCLDMKTMAHEKFGADSYGRGKSGLPKQVRSKRKHTHNALDDAIEQADLFNNIWEYQI